MNHIAMRLILLVNFSLLVFFVKAQNGEDEKYNVVFFLVDDLGWRDVGCYGSEFYKTPNIDRMAGEGVRFTDAYAACHVCSPTRASILTGKYPARMNFTDWLPGRKDFSFQKLKNVKNAQQISFDEETLAEWLKKYGYRTGIFGKWHLGEDPSGPLNHGFDVQFPDWERGWPESYHYPFKLNGFDGEEGEYLTDALTDRALDFIEENRKNPFFLYLSHFAVHDPIEGREDLVEKYKTQLARKGNDEKPPYILEGDPDTEYLLSSRERKKLLEKEDFSLLPHRMVKIKQKQDNPEFAAMVESMDESLGRILSKLNDLGIADKTIVIFFSDNGGMAAANFGNPKRVYPVSKEDKAFSTSNLPLRGAKGWLYEGGIRVPLIIKWPGKGKHGIISHEPVVSTDFYPTILEMLNMPLRPAQHVDGKSMIAFLEGENREEDRPLFWHFPHYSNHGLQSPGGAVRLGDYKLIEYYENFNVQLFNLKDDPGELNDLSDTEPEVAERLKKMLHKWRDSIGAKMMEPNPEFVKAQ